VTVDKNRLWVIGTVLVIGAIVVLGWGLGIAPKLTEVSTAQEELAVAVSENAVQEVRGESLKKQFEGLGALRDELAALQLSVPNSTQSPALIAEFGAISEASQVVISSISQNDAQAYDPSLAGVTTDAVTATTDSGAAEGAAPVAAAPAGPVVDPRITATNFSAIPVTVIVEGSAAGVLDFVSGMQHGERLITVTTVSLSEPAAADPLVAAGTGVVTGTITAFVYVLTAPTAAAPAQ